MNRSDDANNTLKTGRIQLQIIQTIHENETVRLTDIADSVGIGMSTVHRHVTTLEEMGFVVKTGDGVKLSTEFLRLGTDIRYGFTGAEVAEEVLGNLAATTDERVNFFIEEFGYSVCIHRKVGDRGVIAETQIGSRFPMHATAAGKAMLAKMSDERVREIIDRRGLERFTSNTITSAEALFDELATIDESGIAYNDEENITNLRSIGVPVTGVDQEVVGAITISGPTHRLSEDRIDDELKAELLGSANEIELRIEYSD